MTKYGPWLDIGAIFLLLTILNPQLFYSLKIKIAIDIPKQTILGVITVLRIGPWPPKSLVEA